MYCLRDFDADADMLEIVSTFKKWKQIKSTNELESIIKAMSSVVMYVAYLRSERDTLHNIVEEIREDKNHYALRAREAEQELKMLRDKIDPLAKMTKNG